MRILLSSYNFYPSIGGLETTSRMLAEEFVRQGHEVTLITRTPCSVKDEFPFAVVRCPNWLQTVRSVQKCDVYLHNHLSLQSAWPLLFFRRPWVVAIHTWIPRSGIKGFTKHFVLRYAWLISCSNRIAAHVNYPSTVIFSPYDEGVFQVRPEFQRDKDLIFVGRLAKEKGVDTLIEALALIKAEGHEPDLTIVGGGPERDALDRQVQERGINEQVTFLGPKGPSEIAALMSQHRILVVPSIWEPFGIVALEGIACGCLVVGSGSAGLKDAIGPCGVTFPDGDPSALANCLARELREPDALRNYQARALSHLQSCTRGSVACSYLKVLHCAYASAKS